MKSARGPRIRRQSVFVTERSLTWVVMDDSDIKPLSCTFRDTDSKDEVFKERKMEDRWRETVNEIRSTFCYGVRNQFPDITMP